MLRIFLKFAQLWNAERKAKMKIFNGFSFKKQLLLGSNWAKVLECGSKILLIVFGNHLSVFFF